MRIAIIVTTCTILCLSFYYFYPEDKIAEGVQIDKLVASKAQHKLRAYSNGKLIKTYTIAIGKTPVGKKQFEGDQKTPEGDYIIFDKNPNSAYHKNLGISYPNATDLAIAKQLGKPAGGDVKIHGCNNKQRFIGKFHRWTDWTNGCIAVTNNEIDELYEHTGIGTPITVEP